MILTVTMTPQQNGGEIYNSTRLIKSYFANKNVRAMIDFHSPGSISGDPNELSYFSSSDPTYNAAISNFGSILQGIVGNDNTSNKLTYSTDNKWIEGPLNILKSSGYFLTQGTPLALTVETAFTHTPSKHTPTNVRQWGNHVGESIKTWLTNYDASSTTTTTTTTTTAATTTTTTAAGTTKYECENLAYTASGATASTYTDESSRVLVFIAPAATGSYLEFTTSATAGTYDMQIAARYYSSRGIYQMSIDGVNQGSAQDYYASGVVYQQTDIGNVTFTTSGTHTIRFTCTSKNASSTGYSIYLDYFQFTPVTTTTTTTTAAGGTKYEFENLASTPTVGTNGAFYYADAGASNGNTVGLDCSVTSSITFTIPNVTAGTYNLKYQARKSTNKGIYQLIVNGNNVGSPTDYYASSGSYYEYDMGTVTFSTTGSQTIKFSNPSLNKNAASSDCDAVFDYIKLTAN